MYIELKVVINEKNLKMHFFSCYSTDTSAKNVSDFIVENRKVFTAKACGGVAETEC